jgi:hypothetical protein
MEDNGIMYGSGDCGWSLKRVSLRNKSVLITLKFFVKIVSIRVNNKNNTWEIDFNIGRGTILEMDAFCQI